MKNNKYRPFEFLKPNERRDFLARPNRVPIPPALFPWRRLEKVARIGCVAFVIAALLSNLLPNLLPYLSLDPVRSWYALNNGVPVERVQVEKKPHECEYNTAPIGSKYCHYDAKIFVLKGIDSPDGKEALLVTYERVEE